MPVVIIIGVVFLIGAIIGVVVVLGQRKRATESFDERLSKFTDSNVSLEELELEEPFYHRVIVPIMRSLLNVLGKFGPKQNAEKLKLSLQAAGNPGGITPTIFSGMRIGLAVLLMVVIGGVTFLSMAPAQAMMYSAIGVGVGYMMPGIWLGQQIKKRKHNIQRALPDALDLLTISVEAGLGFDIALQRVTDKWDDELSREFKRVLADIRLGRTRREALRDLASRTDVEDVQIFTSAIIQAEQLGVSIAKILRLQSDQMRMRRRQRAEQKAQQAPVLMLFPMVFFIFPSIFVVILGPAIPKIMEGLGGV